METRTAGVFRELIYIGKHQNFGALDCALGDRDSDDPKGPKFLSQIFCFIIL